MPVVVCLQGLAASGGYYVAQAGDTIIAYPTCITGSIGVIAMKFNLQGLMDKVGVDEDVVKTGKWKDFWSPFRPATPQEKEMMQQVIDDFYRNFVNVVAQGRKLSLKKTREVADGRIFTASQARDLGLVDQLGYLDDALELARVKAGLDGPRVVTYHRPGSYKPTIYSLYARPGHGGAPVLVPLVGRQHLRPEPPDRPDEFFKVCIPQPIKQGAGAAGRRRGREAQPARFCELAELYFAGEPDYNVS